MASKFNIGKRLRVTGYEYRKTDYGAALRWGCSCENLFFCQKGGTLPLTCNYDCQYQFLISHHIRISTLRRQGHKPPNKYTFLHFLKLQKNWLVETRQTVISYACLEGQSYEAVFGPVGLVVSRVEGVAISPTLAELPHSPLPTVLDKSIRRLGAPFSFFFCDIS